MAQVMKKDAALSLSQCIPAMLRAMAIKAQKTSTNVP